MNLLLFLLALAALIGLWAWLRWRSLTQALNEYAQNLRLAASEEAARLPQPAHASLQNVAAAVEHLQRRNQESALAWQTGQIRLAALLEQMTDGVLTVTRQGQIDFANPAAASILGQASLEGRSVVEALRDHRLVNLWKACLQTGEPQSDSLEIPLRRQSLQVTVLADTQHPGGALLLLHDLTRLRRLETVRRDFISNLSHELRTPLASLKALAETLRDGALQDPQAAPQFLARIEAEVEALNQMSAELLDLSRIESGQLALRLSSFRPAALLQSATERMQAQVERAGLALSVHLDPDLPSCRPIFNAWSKCWSISCTTPSNSPPPEGKLASAPAPCRRTSSSAFRIAASESPPRSRPASLSASTA